MSPEQQALVLEIKRVFGDRPFDVTDVYCRAEEGQLNLANAIKAAVPHCRYRSGYLRGKLRDRPLRRVLTELAKECFEKRWLDGWGGRWSIREDWLKHVNDK
jgi:hypothetical protein